MKVAEEAGIEPARDGLPPLYGFEARGGHQTRMLLHR